jgi:hypothetical protein
MMPDQTTLRTLYKKLLGLYPRTFREQLGESMAQTFDDLCAERRRQSQRSFLVFTAWMFAETAIGIVRERNCSLKEMNSMKYTLANLKTPALVSLLVILPFMLLEFVLVVAKRPADFSLRNALDVVVVFGFLWLSIAAVFLILMPIVRGMRARNNPGTAPSLAQARATPTFSATPRLAALVGLILAMPFVTLLALLVLGVEPPFGALLRNPDPDQPDVLGSLLVVGAFLLAVLACVIARAPIVRAIQAGGSLLAHPLNLALAAALLLLVVAVVGGVIIDQFPCWIGVPNCD